MQSPFDAYRDVVRPEWIDDNGHMNMGFYLVVFDIASTPFFHFMGLTPEHRRRARITTFAAESHIVFLREVREGDPMRFQSRLIGFDAKRIHFASRMFHANDEYLAATVESLSLHIDLGTRRVAPMAAEIQARLTEIKAAHDRLPPWGEIGRHVSLQARRLG